MTDEETSKIDPVIPIEVWRPVVWDLFLRMADYNLVVILLDDPEMLHRIAEKSLALERLGAARRSVIEDTFYRLHGVLTRDYWHRQGFGADEMLLDEDGDVVAVMLPERFFGSGKMIG